ncbi:MAG: phytoene/squalene synthase family protein [Gemmatimonadales bacterium]
MLPRVSRTFAICIHLLPADLRHSVLVAYLLCRIADTIEDTTGLDPDIQVDLLTRFRRSLDPGRPADAAFIGEAFPDAKTSEEVLAKNTVTVLDQFGRLPPGHQAAVRPWVQEMCSGMAEFVGAGRRRLLGGLDSLATVEELDRYCYYVAGTVGHLLTELFRLHRDGMRPERYRRLESLATSFGLGLQLTNIIKDVADDQRRGWSFVPRQLCQLAGIRPEELQDGRHQAAGRQVMLQLIHKAKGHLLDALEYCTVLPRRDYGIRLFCLTSLYFAVRTLRLAEADSRLLDPGHKVKISRGEVRRTIAAVRLVAPINRLVRGYFRLLAGSRWTGPLAPSALPAAASSPAVSSDPWRKAHHTNKV